MYVCICLDVCAYECRYLERYEALDLSGAIVSHGYGGRELNSWPLEEQYGFLTTKPKLASREFQALG